MDSGQSECHAHLTIVVVQQIAYMKPLCLREEAGKCMTTDERLWLASPGITWSLDGVSGPRVTGSVGTGWIASQALQQGSDGEGLRARCAH